MFVPTPAQQKIIDHFDGHAIVIAGPGSGKTVTLIAHVKKLIQEHGMSPEDIWVMAFNRDISSKLGEKLNSELGKIAPQSSTIHTFILQQIYEKGRALLDDVQIADDLGECGKKELLWKPIRQRLKHVHNTDKTSSGKRLDIRHIKGELWQQLSDYWLTSQLPNDPIFEKFKYEVERFKGMYKIVFLDELARRFLDALSTNPSFRKSIAKRRIIIDEFQDLNPTEHQILLQLHQEGTTFLVLGDDDQAVNDFRRAHADYIHEFIQTLSPTQYPLPRDRRCPKEILELADEFVKGLPRLAKSAGNAQHRGRVDIVAFSDDESEKTGVAKIVEVYLSQNPEPSENPQVLILAGNIGRIPGKSRISEIVEQLRNSGIDNVTGEQRDDPLDTPWGLAFKSLLKMLVKEFSPLSLAAWLSVTHPALLQLVNDYIVKEERKGKSIDFLQATNDLKRYEFRVQEALEPLENLKRHFT